MWRVLMQTPHPVWLPVFVFSLTPQRWYTAVPMVGCTLTTRPCYRDNRDWFWYSIREKLTAMFGCIKAQLCSSFGHSLVNCFNLTHFQIGGSWDWINLNALPWWSDKFKFELHWNSGAQLVLNWIWIILNTNYFILSKQPG